MSPIHRAITGSLAGLLTGGVTGPLLGIVSFLGFHVCLNLTTENPSPESLGPLFSMVTGGAMGLAVGIPTGLIVGAAIGIYAGGGNVNIKAVAVGVLAGTFTCAATLPMGFFFPPLGNASVIAGAAFTIGAGALTGIAAGTFIAHRDRTRYPGYCLSSRSGSMD